MLFKAIWSKVVQTKTKYLYCTVDPDSEDIVKLYVKKLDFEDIGINVCYGNSSKKWKLLRLDCLNFEKKYATRSRLKFKLMKYYRENLKEISLLKLNTTFQKIVDNFRNLFD